MRNQKFYEWDFETTDEAGEILDHHFEDKLSDLRRHFEDGDHGDLVLTIGEGNEADGRDFTAWAYVKDGKMPDCFTDSMGNEYPGMPVPERFKKELAAFLAPSPHQ